MKKKYTLDMTEGVIWKQIVIFTIPLVLGDLLQQFYNVADSIVIGRYVGKNALAAISAVEYPINIIIGLFTGLSLGSTVTVSHAFGAKDIQRLKNAIQTTMLFSVIVAAALTLAGLLMIPWILNILLIPEEIRDMVRAYMQIYFAGVSGLVFYNMCGGILRAIGDSRRPLYALIFSTFLNVTLNLVLVLKFDLNVRGVAFATITSQFLSAFYLLYVICCRIDPAYRVELGRLYIKGDVLKNILNVGLPMGIQKSLLAVSNTMVSSRINSFGADTMAAWGVYRKLDQTIIYIPQNIGAAASTFVGQNLGGGKRDRIRTGSRVVLLMGGLSALALALTVILFRRPLISLFNADGIVMEIGSLFICTLLPVQWLSGITQVEAGISRGYGKSIGPMMILLFSNIVMRQLFLQIGWLFVQTQTFVALSYVVGWGTGLVVMSFYLRHMLRKQEVKESVNTNF